jgi:curli biogenesis system outer membrane secretion channel CsgG
LTKEIFVLKSVLRHVYKKEDLMNNWSKISGYLGLMFIMILGACAESKKAEPVMPIERPIELSGPKKRIGIFEFKNKSRYGQDKLSRAAVDVMYSELEKSGKFILYERAELAQLEREFDLIESGKINLATAAEPGKLTGIQAVVVGTISQFGIWEEAKDYGVYKKKTEIAEATVDIRVVNITTGRQIFAETGTGRTERELETVLGFGEKATFDETMADKALRAAISQFMNNLVRTVSELPWEGRVADVSREGGAEIVYVNAGRRSGMPASARLIIYRVTGTLTDPVTQEFLGYKKRKLGEAEVVDYTGEDASMARMITGGGVSRGDIVVLAKDAGKL